MKHVPPPRLASSLAICGVLACAVALGPASGSRAAAQGAPPPPPAPNATTRVPTAAPTVLTSTAPLPAGPLASPSASAEPRGRRGKGKAGPAAPGPQASAPEPSATPTSPAFATLDGTWEVQVQYIDRTEYSYFTIAQGATGTLSGSWKVAGKPYSFEGTYDGRLIRMVVKQPDRTVTMSGYVEGASDMVGTVDFGNGKTELTAFTAEHRPSAKGSIFKKGV